MQVLNLDEASGLAERLLPALEHSATVLTDTEAKNITNRAIQFLTTVAKAAAEWHQVPAPVRHCVVCLIPLLAPKGGVGV